MEKKYIYLVKGQHLQCVDYNSDWADLDIANLYETTERWETHGTEYHWLSGDKPVKGRYYLAQTCHGPKVIEVTGYRRINVTGKDPQLYFLERYSVTLKYLICILPRKLEVYDRLRYIETAGFKCCEPSQYAWNKLEALFHEKEVKTRKSKPRRISKTEALEMKKGGKVQD